MTNYQLQIKDANLKPHLDLEEEITTKKNGILTFTVRVNNGNMVDLNITEYVPIQEKYGIVKMLVIEEVVINVSDENRAKQSELEGRTT